MTIAQTEVGKKYNVINGQWRFEVVAKSETHTTIKALGSGAPKKPWDVPNTATKDELNIEEI